jgi:hypothetical protein
MGDMHTPLTTAEMADRIAAAAALLRDPKMRQALDVLAEAAEADRTHARRQAARRAEARTLAEAAGATLGRAEALRSVTRTLASIAEARHAAR